jgi:hypothetical protein
MYETTERIYNDCRAAFDFFKNLKSRAAEEST